MFSFLSKIKIGFKVRLCDSQESVGKTTTKTKKEKSNSQQVKWMTFDFHSQSFKADLQR